jgi:pyruvate dehydrogenase E1 component alpha subunit
MHLFDDEVNFMASVPIVGSAIPLAVGSALSSKIDRDEAVSLVFLGDGSLEEGVFHESANFASLNRLPVIFACENNLYSVYSPLEVRQPTGRSLAHTAAALGLIAVSGDGNDVLASYELIKAAADRARSGQGPQFVELATYRWREHCGPNYDNAIGYRSEEEFEAWKALDPIARLTNSLLLEGTIDPSWIEALTRNIRAEVDGAFDFAEASAFPPASDAFTDLYSKEVVSYHP